MNERELQILISMRDEFSAKLTGIDSSLQKTTKEAKRAQTGFKNLMATLGSTAVVYASLRLALSSVKEYGALEEAQFRLATITNNATGATREQIEELFKQAEQLERIGVIDKTAIMSAQAKLATFDLQTSSIKELTPQLLNMAVAENGVNVTSEQLINMANGLGKAVQGQTDMLIKNGFVISDTEKRMLKTGNETERMATLNGILARTYDDVNEKASQTTQGALVKFQNKIGDIKENIGRALTPTLIELIGIFDDTTNSTLNSSIAFEKFGETIYRTTNFLMGVASSIKTGIQATTAVLDVGFTKIADTITGKNKADQLADGWNELLTESAKKTTDKFNKWMTGEGFEMPEFNLFGSNKENFGTDEIIRDLDDLKKSISDVSEKYVDLGKTAGDALVDLKAEHTDAVTSIKKDIDDVNKKLKDLSSTYKNDLSNALKAYNSESKDNTKTVAEAIVDNEEAIATLQANIAGGKMNKDDRRSAEAELATRLQAEKDNADLIVSLAGEIKAVRDYNSLSELSQAVSDFQTKQSLAQQEYSENIARIKSEYNEKRNTLKQELNDLRDKLDDEQTLYDAKVAYINDVQTRALITNKEFASANVKVTAEQVKAEIAYYNELADAIRNAKSGNKTKFSLIKDDINSIQIPSVTNVKDAIITPYGDIIKTDPLDYLIATKNPKNLGGGKSITINISTMIGNRQYAEEMGDYIIKTLQLQGQI